ncbi:GNAT family N-acetyltransferase [Salinibacillus aidingensis]|uniref:GNAT family N-acetyltransferase n=1 Tax=Salinibacillus aidingensis TaxID=237684 RepID=A0ABP3LHT1_9BACI
MYRISLEKFKKNDFDFYFSLVSNESVMAMITERSIPMKEAQENFQKLLDTNNDFEGFGTYKVFNSKNDEFIGLGKLIKSNENKEAELGYMVLPEYWGKGYGSEIAEILLENANKLSLNRVTAIIDPNNLPSRKILIKKGFISEKICDIDGLPGEYMSKVL